MSSVSRLPASPGAPPDTPLQPAWKGAWGGAWAVLYGCLAVLFGTWTISVIDFLTTGSRFWVAQFRTNVPADADADFVQRVEGLIAGAPAALGASLRGWTWAGIALGGVVVLAGLGVIGRSALARRVAVAAVLGSGLLSLGVLVWWALRVLPAYDAWREAGMLLADDARRQGGRNPIDIPIFRMLPGRSAQIATHSVSQVIQLVVVAALVRRLTGRSARAWCGERG